MAQNLRESVKLNAAPSKKPLWKKPIEKISLSDGYGCKNALRTNVTQKINTTKNTGGKSLSIALQSDAATSIASRKIPVKKQSRTSPTSSTVKSKSKRNFILENRLNLKKIVPLNKSQIGACSSKNTPRTVCIIFYVEISQSFVERIKIWSLKKIM